VGIVAVAAAIVAVSLLPGGGGGAKSALSAGPGTPEFAFETTKVLAVPTRAGVKAEQLRSRVRAPAAQVTKIMDAIYTGAFLDPGNWQEGSYDPVWTLFESGAGTEARAQVDTLTAGSNAGGTFETIVPTAGSTLKIKVLMAPNDEPYSVVAIVRFRANGKGKDGRNVQMLSTGQFLFQKVDGSWKVVSFKVARDDRQRTASPSPSASGSSS